MFVESAKVTEGYRSVLPECDLVVGTEEEIRIAGGSTRYPRGAPRHPRALRRDDRAQGRRDGGHRLSRRDPRRPRGRRQRAGLSRGGLQLRGRGRRLYERLSLPLAAGRAAGGVPADRERLRRHRRLPPRLLAGHADPRRAGVLPGHAREAAPAPRRRVARAPAQGHDAPGAEGATRARHRPPLAARGGRGRARCGPRASAGT